MPSWLRGKAATRSGLSPVCDDDVALLFVYEELIDQSRSVLMVSLSEDFRTLFEGGFTIADECLSRAIRSIDLRFGQGYAKAHPELVATYMTIAAQEFDSSSTQKRQHHLVENSLNRLSAMLEELLTQYQTGNSND